MYARIYVLKKNIFYELTLFNRRKTVNKVCCNSIFVICTLCFWAVLPVTWDGLAVPLEGEEQPFCYC